MEPVHPRLSGLDADHRPVLRPRELGSHAARSPTAGGIARGGRLYQTSMSPRSRSKSTTAIYRSIKPTAGPTPLERQAPPPQHREAAEPAADAEPSAKTESKAGAATGERAWGERQIGLTSNGLRSDSITQSGMAEQSSVQSKKADAARLRVEFSESSVDEIGRPVTMCQNPPGESHPRNRCGIPDEQRVEVVHGLSSTQLRLSDQIPVEGKSYPSKSLVRRRSLPGSVTSAPRGTAGAMGSIQWE